MMELASMASFSDAHEQKEIPIIAANLHRAILPSTDRPLIFFNIELNRQRFKSQYQDKKAAAMAEPAFPFGWDRTHRTYIQANKVIAWSGLRELFRYIEYPIDACDGMASYRFIDLSPVKLLRAGEIVRGHGTKDHRQTVRLPLSLATDRLQILQHLRSASPRRPISLTPSTMTTSSLCFTLCSHAPSFAAS